MVALAEAARESLRGHLSALGQVNVEQMRDVARAVYEDPALLAEFDRDPEGIARKINGFVVPEGFHIHIADAENRLTPAETYGKFGAEDREDWQRVEFRVGYKTFSLVMCG